MTRLTLCCLYCILLAPFGCLGSGDDADEGGQKVLPPKPMMPTREAGPCAGDDCTGRMPFGAGCEDDDVVRATATFPGGTVELHHSPSCDTRWAVVRRANANYSIAWVETEDGEGLVETEIDRDRALFSSAMIHAPGGAVRACVRPLPCKDPCETKWAAAVCTDYQ